MYNALYIYVKCERNSHYESIVYQRQSPKTELIHLYDLDYRGCISCFACKLKNAKTNGLCAMKDDLRSVLEKALAADVIVIGSPVYYGYPTGMTRSFLERLLFPADTYKLDENGVRQKILDRTIQTGMIFTMNVNEEWMEDLQYETILGFNGTELGRMFGYNEILYVNDTFQFRDYSRYDVNLFDADQKAQRREEHFPIDLKNAFQMGKSLAEKANAK